MTSLPPSGAGLLPAAPPAATTGGQRRDIQGLRALAVTVVVLDHLLGRPAGGFLGVDVFFVLSGFLITGLLVSERTRRGSVSLADFYRRRARRLLPAAVLVLAVTVLTARLLLPGPRSREVAVDAVWGLLFASNWRFAAVGTDYFTAGGPVSPLQHYWSLAVEEQFYLVWPTLLAVGFWLARGSARRLSLVVAVLALALAGWSLWHTGADPTLAYFSTLDRSWELLAGAAAALARPLAARVPGRARAPLSWLGLVVVVASVALVDEGVGVPAPGALPAVLGTVLVLVAGVGDQGASAPRVLTLRPVGYVGDLSYSLYLWHFPVIVLMAAVLPRGGPAYLAACVVTMLALAALSYHLVEDPIRHSSWLEPRHRRFLHGRRPTLSSRQANAWVGVLAVVAVLLTAVVLRGPRAEAPVLLGSAPPAAAAQGGQGGQDGQGGQGGGSAPAYLAARIEQSLTLEAVPALSPSIDTLGFQAWAEQLLDDGCADVLPGSEGACRFGDPAAPRVAVVLGDSYAMAWTAGVRAALEPRGWQVQQLTLQECPVWDAPRLRFDGRAYPECDDYRTWADQQVASLSPDLLVLASSDRTASTLASGASGAAAAEEVGRAMARRLERLTGAARTVVLAPPPGSAPLLECATRFASPDDCESEVPAQRDDYVAAERAASEAAGATYVETEDWFCSAGLCPAFVGTTPVYTDGLHLTAAYSRELAPVLAGALLREVNNR